MSWELHKYRPSVKRHSERKADTRHTNRMSDGKRGLRLRSRGHGLVAIAELLGCTTAKVQDSMDYFERMSSVN